MRIGIGYDIHPLKEGRKLVLGGADIPFEKGLDGWSDADALVHAVIDALLGAAALGDIGHHFPPGDEEFKDISSIVLLERTRRILSETGWEIVNVDATVIAERPKLQEYIDSMRQNISRALDIDISRVSVKASTNNGVGSLGHGDGIAAYAAALIEGRQ